VVTYELERSLLGAIAAALVAAGGAPVVDGTGRRATFLDGAIARIKTLLGLRQTVPLRASGQNLSDGTGAFLLPGDVEINLYRGLGCDAIKHPAVIVECNAAAFDNQDPLNGNVDLTAAVEIHWPRSPVDQEVGDVDTPAQIAAATDALDGLLAASDLVTQINGARMNPQAMTVIGLVGRDRQIAFDDDHYVTRYNLRLYAAETAL
jgi:hypothetical protein